MGRAAGSSIMQCVPPVRLAIRTPGSGQGAQSGTRLCDDVHGCRQRLGVRAVVDEACVGR